MKIERYYTDKDLEEMTVSELGEIVKSQQMQLQTLYWRLRDTKEFLIAALQALPQTVKL